MKQSSLRSTLNKAIATATCPQIHRNKQHPQPVERFEPIDVVINAQHGRHGNYRKESSKKCSMCDRTNHVDQDCFFLKKAKEEASESKSKSGKGYWKRKKQAEKDEKARSNAQTTVPVVDKSNKTVDKPYFADDDLDFDITDNLFYSHHQGTTTDTVYQHSQHARVVSDVTELLEVTADSDITHLVRSCSGPLIEEPEFASEVVPTLKGGLWGTAASFIVTVNTCNANGFHHSAEVLMDTGANVSTIARYEVDRLDFKCRQAAPLHITYGNGTTTTSTEVIWMPISIYGVDFGGYFLRVVQKQNLPILMGMNWFLIRQLILDLWTKSVIPRE